MTIQNELWTILIVKVIYLISLWADAKSDAVTWEIGNSLITEFAAMLGLSDEEVDAFFKTASQIEIE